MDYKLHIQKSINYIENNLCREIKLTDIAKQSYFSEYYFHRLFRNITGLSVMEYVRRRRLTEAAADLKKTDERITGIAFKYQFSSEESFSRAFKRMYGISPRMYRNTGAQIENSENVYVLNAYSRHCLGNRPALSMAA